MDIYWYTSCWIDTNCHGWISEELAGTDRFEILRGDPRGNIRALSSLEHGILRQECCGLV